MYIIKGIVATVLVAALPLAALAASEEALAKSKGCLACHTVDKKVIGPAYKDVAAKYKSDKGAEANLVKSVTTGSSGKWGQIPMPANNVTEAEAKKLVAWILSL
ncbi:MAG: c-type cytochrome [Betaproteobacteria bacterium]|nr:c-type cytochrome [Betaproteobacteria bacterium]